MLSIIVMQDGMRSCAECRESTVELRMIAENLIISTFLFIARQGGINRRFDTWRDSE
jgi:hypothetical protein